MRSWIQTKDVLTGLKQQKPFVFAWPQGRIVYSVACALQGQLDVSQVRRAKQAFAGHMVPREPGRRANSRVSLFLPRLLLGMKLSSRQPIWA